MSQSSARKREHSEGTNGESPAKKRDAKEEGEELLSSSEIVTDEKVIDGGSDKTVEDKDPEDYFPFNALPTELISHSISFLSMKDRQRVAGVNNKLKTIEKESKYYVKRLIIDEITIEDEEFLRDISERMKKNSDDTNEEKEGIDEKDDEESNEEEEEENTDEEDEEEEEKDDEEEEEEDETAQRITFHYTKSYSSDCIRRLTQNVSIGKLNIVLHKSTEFNRDVYNLIKELDIEELSFREGYQLRKELLKEMMVDSSFLDFTKACKSLVLDQCYNITPEALHRVYKNMLERSTKLRHLRIYYVHQKKDIEFLKLIGITYRDATLFSMRGDIEVYKCKDDKFQFLNSFNIYDGSLMIVYRYGIGCLEFKLHETKESIEEAKNRPRTVKLDISPE